MANRSVTVRLAAEVGNYLSGMKQAQSATDQLGSTTQKTAKNSEGAFSRLASAARNNEQAWSTVSTGLMGVGTAAVAGAGMAVKKFADFDKAMSSVQAATHASAGDMDALRDAAIRTGADTAFSAEEAARGIEELAKAGVSTSDILGGGLDGSLALAAAGALDVGQAAEIASSAMTQFKLEGSQVGHIADLLAAGAGKAQGSVQDLGAALNQSGLVASQAGLSIEETVGGLAAFASAGLTGSDAGTSFKTMLQRLNPQSKEAAALMDELGLTAYDSQGNFIGLSEYAGKLQGALSGMSDEQRNAAMQTLFGADAVRAAAVLYEQGAAGVEKWEASVNDAGYAAETAALMQDNLAGDLEKLGGAFDTVFLKAGSGPNTFLRGIVQGAESAVDAIGKIPSPVLSAGAALAGIAGTGMLIAGGLMKGITAISETKAALETLGITAEGTKGKLAGFGKGVGLATGMAVLAKGLIEITDASAPAATGLADIENALAGVPGNLDAVNALFRDAEWANGNQGGFAGAMHGTVEGINSVGDALTRLQNTSAGEDLFSWGNDILGAEDNLNTMRDQIQSVDEAISNMASSGNMEGAAEQFRAVMDSVSESGGDVQEAASQFDDYRAAVQDYATSLGVTLSDQETFQAMMGEMPASLVEAAGGADQAADGISGLGDESEDTAASLEDIISSLQMLGELNMSVAESTGAFHEAQRNLAETLAQTGVALNEQGTAFDVTTQAGYEAQQAFDGMARSGWDMAEAMANNGASLGEVQGALQSTYDGLINTGTQFGLTAEQAEALARNVMGIPEEKSVETWMDETAKTIAEATGQSIDAIPAEKWVDIAVSDQGSADVVRAKIDSMHGKQIDTLVTDKGTVQLTQEQINAIYGKTTKIAVTDKGTVFQTQGKIDGVTDGDATIIVDENGVAHVQGAINGVQDGGATVHVGERGVSGVQGAINGVQGKTVYIDVIKRYGSLGGHVSNANDSVGVMKRATGGRAPGLAGVPAAAVGMRLPTTGPGTGVVDGILGVSASGMPRVRVDAGEWITNRRSSDKYDTVLGMINSDHPAVQHLAGLAAGGRLEHVPTPGRAYATAAPEAPPMVVKTDPAEMRQALQGATLELAFGSERVLANVVFEGARSRRGR